jgi:hypothetical protein
MSPRECGVRARACKGRGPLDKLRAETNGGDEAPASHDAALHTLAGAGFMGAAATRGMSQVERTPCALIAALSFRPAEWICGGRQSRKCRRGLLGYHRRIAGRPL